MLEFGLVVRRSLFVAIVALPFALACGGSVSQSSEGGSGAVAGSCAAGGSGAWGGRLDVDDLIIRSNVMSPYEGLRVFATFDHNFGDNSRSDARFDVISNGTFELVWEKQFIRDSFGAYTVLFVDRGGDALCTPDVDPAWMDFVNNYGPAGAPEIFTFDPNTDDASFGPLSCDQFNAWFDEEYRPPCAAFH